jgi:hypothetical protein
MEYFGSRSSCLFEEDYLSSFHTSSGLEEWSSVYRSAIRLGSYKVPSS